MIKTARQILEEEQPSCFDEVILCMNKYTDQFTSSNKSGHGLITSKRILQIEKYPIEDDKRYKSGELLFAAKYLMGYGQANLYPRTWSSEMKWKFDHMSQIDKLTTAGALIAAEIDRIQNS